MATSTVQHGFGPHDEVAGAERDQADRVRRRVHQVLDGRARPRSGPSILPDCLIFTDHLS